MGVIYEKSDILNSKGWMITAISMFLSVLITLIVMKFKESIAKYSVGFLFGLILSFFLNILFIGRINFNGENYLLRLITPVFGGACAGGFSDSHSQEALIIFSSINGGYLIMRALSLLIGGFPAEEDFSSKLINKDTSLNTWAIIGYYAGFILISFLGMHFQEKYRNKKKNESNNNDIYVTL